MIPQTNIFEDSNRNDFLELFDTTRRSLVSNLFLNQCRDFPNATAGMILLKVKQHLEYKIIKNWSAARDKDILRVVTDNPAKSLRFAQWALGYVAMPAEEREQAKAERGKEHVAPTQRQIAFLDRLGYSGPLPASMAAAGSAIDELMMQGGGRS